MKQNMSDPSVESFEIRNKREYSLEDEVMTVRDNFPLSRMSQLKRIFTEVIWMRDLDPDSPYLGLF